MICDLIVNEEEDVIANTFLEVRSLSHLSFRLVGQRKGNKMINCCLLVVVGLHSHWL